MQVPVEPVVEEPAPPDPPRFWPESLREEAVVDPFPIFTLLKWLLPGLIISAILLGTYFWLRQQAAHKIVYLTPERQLYAVRADGDEVQMLQDVPFVLSSGNRARLEQTTAVLGMPHWSPNGRYLAVTTPVNNGFQVVLFSPFAGLPTTISSRLNEANILAMPASGWSPDSNHLALVESDGERPFISLVTLPTEEKDINIIPVDSMNLDTRAGLSWHPDSDKFLVTVLPTGSTASTLQLIDLEGNAEPFIALDQQLFRADAVWSPDGEQVAYITVDPADSGNPDYLAGQLWVASSNGQNPRRLVSDGLNMAPIWDAADPSRIYFTRYLTTTNSFRLFSTSAFSAQSEKPMVPASDVLIRYPFDRAHYWQPPTGANPNFSVSSTPTPSANPFEITFDMVIQTHIRRFVPLLGMPRWSPDGRYIATTQWQNGRIQPLLFNSNLQSLTAPSSSSEILAVPGDGWSASSNLLALIEHDGTRPLLTLYNMAEKRPIALEFTLDTRAGLDWHPINDQLLVTAYTDDAQPPSLHLIEANGSERALNPSDNQLFRADGVWSPDGTQIAYVADDVYSTTQDILAGNLWLADSVGNGPRLLVPDMLAVAPVWSPLGDFIFFTRFDDENGRFSLYRVPSDGSTLAQYIGAGTETAVLYPFDRNNLLQWSSDGKQLHFIGAGSRLPERYLDIMLTDSDLEQLRQAVPLVGTLQASPDGSEYAATVIQNGQFQVAYFLSDNSPPIMSPPSDDIIAFPTSGWSSDGSYLALLRHSAEDTRLAVLDTIQSDLSTKNLVIDTRAGLSWHPQRAQIMLTSPLEGITPTLQIHNMVDNTTEPFAPDDGQIVHGDGVWSPTGQLVAYIARDSITDTVDVLAGSLWIAEADGSNPQELVDEGHNLAPMWDFFNGRILFTRYMTETDNYDLYQVDLQGTTVERLGPSTPAMAQFPFDRQLFLRWSPDGRRWLLPGATAEPPLLLYQAAFDGTGVGLLAEQCEETRRPFVVRWTPTNRALLIACPTGDMFLHWLDSDRDNTPLTDEGLLPSWQP